MTWTETSQLNLEEYYVMRFGARASFVTAWGRVNVGDYVYWIVKSKINKAHWHSGRRNGHRCAWLSKLKIKAKRFSLWSTFKKEETARIAAICKDEHSSQMGFFHIIKWDCWSVRFAVDLLNAADVSFLVLLSSFFLYSFFFFGSSAKTLSHFCDLSHLGILILYLYSNRAGTDGKAE